MICGLKAIKIFLANPERVPVTIVEMLLAALYTTPKKILIRKTYKYIFTHRPIKY